MQTETHASETPIASTRTTKTLPAHIEYMHPEGNFVRILFDLARNDEKVRLQRLIHWAACNKVEIRIRPLS